MPTYSQPRPRGTRVADLIDSNLAVRITEVKHDVATQHGTSDVVIGDVWSLTPDGPVEMGTVWFWNAYDGRLSGRRLQARRALALQMYGTRCHLCGEPVRLDVDWRHPLAYQLEHRIPLYHGGSEDDRESVQYGSCLKSPKL